MTSKTLIKSLGIASFFGMVWLLAGHARAATSRGSKGSLLVLGDSQVKRHLGQAYTDAFPETDVRFFGKEGASPKDFLSDSDILKFLKAAECADVILVQLGDNGISANPDHVTQLVQSLSQKCPNASLVWTGPVKAVRPSIPSNYVNLEDSSSPRFLPNYNRLRKVWDSRLQSALASTNVEYISIFDMQAAQPINSEFNDTRKGDGVHLTKESAEALAALMRPVLQRLSPRLT